LKALGNFWPLRANLPEVIVHQHRLGDPANHRVDLDLDLALDPGAQCVEGNNSIT
jgi:hypothetical protein